jgi:transcriptional regulator with XRE-family HTH domain
MTSTADLLRQKNQEGLTLLLKLLMKLGVSHRELARRLGVSPPMFSYWTQQKLRMSPEDQTVIYGVFAKAVTQRWPEGDEQKQHELLPLMEQLVQTWQDAPGATQAPRCVPDLLHATARLRGSQGPRASVFAVTCAGAL